ncbi:deoxyguanosinetriphosphate triphosphohydrolase [Corynebacterium sp. 13CS0277]|uniref:deoxyguanosinetriphosphate triphosphohydrolase n=1 Tax=Corynebacterium sp. 13CS0277 TaxID=2071994 RepID=UPI000D02C5B5|nr:deoxyguanosinetriphosphate triphosphohydrolase [Corynebacterium sp. 13CS0277]PRQ10916.1 deoxyguanosinetriphosphate triphosphohydrolase [Corynebacterium sp. 13CS0277]
MYTYSAHDAARLEKEGAKPASIAGLHVDERDAFARDRARVLHSAALRRLADKTQVVGPRDGDTPRTRLTHSLEVAQIARGIGQGLGVSGDLAELAGLCHDIGHPPYGHNGEVALNEVAASCGGFEGNAQTLRILTRLEPKVIVDGRSFGLNLTRASLAAACKYPWTRTQPDGSVKNKYGCYDEDRWILDWVLDGEHHPRPPIEGQIMDCADDFAYSVHDVEDGIVSGEISMKVLWDFAELMALADRGAKAYGGDAAALVDAADRLRSLDVVARAADFDGSYPALATLKAMTSQLVGRYVGATVAATKANAPGPFGRYHGNLIVPEDVAAEVMLLKTIAVLYVMDDPGHLARQDRQRDRIYQVFDYLRSGAPGSLDPAFRWFYEQASSEAERTRVIVDQIASMTESRLELLARDLGAFAGFLE